MGGVHSTETLAALERGLAGVLSRWGLSGAALRLINISENATFRADPADGAAPVILRVHRPGYHTRAEIESELAWIAALRADDRLRTPAIRPADDGARIVDIAAGGLTRHVVAFAHAPGEEPRQDAALVPGFRRLGALSARLHDHARQWSRPAEFIRKTWTFDAIAGPRAHWGPWQAAPGLTDAGHAVLARLAETLRARLADWGTGPDRFGLIHADLRLANLLVQGDRLTVIDFDDCGFGWFLFDFAAAVSFIEDDPALPALMAAWVAGYRDVAALSDAEAAMLPSFVMLRRLQLTAWIASHSETPTAQELGAEYTRTTVALAERYLAAPEVLPRVGPGQDAS